MPDESTSIRDPRRRRWWFAKLADLAVGVTFCFTLTVFGARWHWLLDLTAHFALQLAIVAAGAGTILLVTRHWWLAGLAGLLLVVNVVRLWPLMEFSAAAAGEHDLRCVSANVLGGNDDFGRFIAFLEAERPDVVVLIEVDESWREPLEAVRDDYPHQHRELRDDAFGIALLSRFPLVDVQVVRLGPLRLPSLYARVAVGGELVTIVGTHPLPPMGGAMSAERNDHLRSLAQLAAGRQGPIVLLGDLNVTPWSPYFGDLLRDGNLQDARVGRGLHPTWPNLPWPLRIPIDHALVSPGVEVLDFRAGPAIGSDHRPVIVDLALPR